MGGDGVSDISAGAGEGVGRMVNGAGLTCKMLTRRPDQAFVTLR